MKHASFGEGVWSTSLICALAAATSVSCGGSTIEGSPEAAAGGSSGVGGSGGTALAPDAEASGGMAGSTATDASTEDVTDAPNEDSAVGVDATTCKEGALLECYSAGPSTKGVGVCKAGEQQCVGGAFGPCTGEVTPSPESCNSVDDDCNGLVDDDCPFSKALGGATEDIGNAVASDSAGNIYVVGEFTGAMNLGNGELMSAGDHDAFLAKFGPDGTLVWAKRLGGSGFDAARGIAVDPNGGLYVIGDSEGDVDLGGGTLSGHGAIDAWIARFTTAGDHVWSKLIGGPSKEIGAAIAIGPDGGPVVTGSFNGSAELGGATLIGTDFHDLFVASYTSAGEHRWSKGVGGPSSDVGLGVAVDALGAVYLAGHCSSALDFGGGAITFGGVQDIVVVSLEPDGQHRWSKGFGGPGFDLAASIAADSDGHLLIAGEIAGPVSFGGPPVQSDDADMFLVELQAANGDHVWSVASGGQGSARALGVGVGVDGRVAVTGQYLGASDFGNGLLPYAGQLQNIFVATYSSSGAPAWSKGFGSAGQDWGTAAAVTSTGAVLATGKFYGVADFGMGSVTSKGNFDAFLLKLAP